MKSFAPLALCAACSTVPPGLGTAQQALDAGGPHCPAAPYVIDATLRSTGLQAADTGTRTVYDPDTYGGSDAWRFLQASADAFYAGNAAVVMSRVFEIDTTVYLYPGVLYTGGGFRRSCNWIDPTYPMIRPRPSPTSSSTYVDGITVDSVLFDGHDDGCTIEDHYWTKNNTMPFRGHSVVKNSAFVATPSENMTVCGGTFIGNVAQDLGGSFVHVSCSLAEAGTPTWLLRNHVTRSNLYGDAVMVHSEGVVTLSNESGGLTLADNVFLDGGEGVFGYFNEPGDNPVTAAADCWENFSYLAIDLGELDPSQFHLRDVMQINVGPVQ